MKSPRACARSRSPRGRTVRHVYEALRDEILADLRAAMPVDAVQLLLHGAMAAEGYDDCEGDLAAHIRAVVGSDVAIGLELDLHCHLPALMQRSADAIVAFKEYPHIDAEPRGRGALPDPRRHGGGPRAAGHGDLRLQDGRALAHDARDRCSPSSRACRRWSGAGRVVDLARSRLPVGRRARSGREALGRDRQRPGAGALTRRATGARVLGPARRDRAGTDRCRRRPGPSTGDGRRPCRAGRHRRQPWRRRALRQHLHPAPHRPARHRQRDRRCLVGPGRGAHLPRRGRGCGARPPHRWQVRPGLGRSAGPGGGRSRGGRGPHADRARHARAAEHLRARRGGERRAHRALLDPHADLRHGRVHRPGPDAGEQGADRGEVDAALPRGVRADRDGGALRHHARRDELRFREHALPDQVAGLLAEGLETRTASADTPRRRRSPGSWRSPALRGAVLRVVRRAQPH